MALDPIWLQFFLHENRRGANYIILAIFFALCVSILAITQGELETLAGVYTISFLAVMAFFAIGNFLLKVKRSKPPRPVYAGVFSVFLALIGVLGGLYGNISQEPGLPGGVSAILHSVGAYRVCHARAHCYSEPGVPGPLRSTMGSGG